MTDSDSWGPGHVIADKFRLTRRLGQGGMGSVWAADHLQLHSAVAVKKIIDPAIAKNEEALGRFMREAQSAAALRSPHVVQTFDYGVHDGVPFIAMELLEGQSLAQRLESVGHLPIGQTASILTQVGRAISRAHEAGIIHRDLKPDNIFLVRNDDEEVAKVLDFGIAKDTGSGLGTSSQTRTGAILGTPFYMSPEQAEGNRKVDHRTDLWSLAIIAYECVLGRRPFESEALGDLILQICVRPIPPPSTKGPVPPGFDEWFAKGTQRDTSLRFESARELTAGLRAVAGIQSAGSDGRGPLQTFSGIADSATAPGQTTGGAGAMAQTTAFVPKSQSTSLIAAATIGALLLGGGGAFLALHSSHGSPSAEPSVVAAAPRLPPATAVAADTAPVPSAAPTPSVVPATAVVTHDAEPAPAPSAARQEPPHPSSAPRAARPSKAAEKPAPQAPPKPAGKQHVDFGF